MNTQNMKLSWELKENNFDKKIEDYQDKLVVIYKRIQELKKGDRIWNLKKVVEE